SNNNRKKINAFNNIQAFVSKGTKKAVAFSKACFFEKNQASNKKLGKKILAGLVVLALFTITTLYYQTTQGFLVYYNGDEIGAVKEIATFEEGLAIVEEQLSQEYGRDIQLNDEVYFQRGTITKQNILHDPQQTAEIVYNNTSDVTVEGAKIVIDGEETGVLGSPEEAEQVIEKVVDHYSDLKENEKLIEEPQIQQDIEIVEADVIPTSIQEIDSVVKYLLQGTEVIEEYKVKDGDTSWDIAVNRGISTRELEDANPQMNIESLRPGDVIQLNEEQPFLDVTLVKEVVEEKEIAFETEYKEDSSIYKGETKKISDGEKGLKEVTSVVEYQNNVLVNKNIVNENVLKEPVAEVVAKGTKPIPPSYGSGSFKMPTSGRVTVINKPGSHAGGRAVDIANSSGTSIYASDSGRVVRASWYSGYGNTVIIDHGNGYKTLYAHLRSISVRVGQNVSKGEYIAAMGTTGNSSGNHLHFEIQKNGQRQKVNNYFPAMRRGSYVSP
ncbi:MAG TPA: hypothetical protein DHN33_08815, partial [Eubacteriaceae bacterium]|nr:hypothetical protein [Eubacteriaceae bacterium]